MTHRWCCCAVSLCHNLVVSKMCVLVTDSTQMRQARGMEVIRKCLKVTHTNCTVSNFLSSNTLAVNTVHSPGAQGAYTFFLNRTDGSLVHCADSWGVGGGGGGVKNEKTVCHTYVSPTTPLLTLMCSLSVHYDLSPPVNKKYAWTFSLGPQTTPQS